MVRRMGGSGDDPVARVTGSLGMISEQLKIIPKALSSTKMSEEIQKVHTRLCVSDENRTKDGALFRTSIQNIASALESAHDPVLTSYIDKVSQEIAQLRNTLLDGSSVSQSVLTLRDDLQKIGNIDLSTGLSGVRNDLQKLQKILSSHLDTKDALQNIEGALVQLQNKMDTDAIVRAIQGMPTSTSSRQPQNAQEYQVVMDAQKQDEIHTLLIREATRFLGDGELQQFSDPTINAALIALFTITGQINDRLKKVTTPKVHKLLMERIQQDLTKTVHKE